MYSAHHQRKVLSLNASSYYIFIKHDKLKKYMHG